MATTEKVSVTIGRTELAHAKRVASRLGLSLSTFITEAVRNRVEEQARREAALAVLATFGPEDRASPAEMRALLEQWGERKRSPQRKARTRHAATRQRR
jgi:hypothetical protein